MMIPILGILHSVYKEDSKSLLQAACQAADDSPFLVRLKEPPRPLARHT
jgi:hypothetical protein